MKRLVCLSFMTPESCRCVYLCVCPTVFAEMSWQVHHHHQSCCFEREPTLWPLCSECESSISLCTQHARKPSFFFFFPVWLREKAAFFPSIFGHMEHRQWAVAFWCRTNIPILCGICTFWNAFSPILPDCGCSIWKCTFKRDTSLLKVKDWRRIVLALAAVSQRSCIFTVLFMIRAVRIQLLMQMSLLKPTFESKTVFYSLLPLQPTATLTSLGTYFIW